MSNKKYFDESDSDEFELLKADKPERKKAKEFDPENDEIQESSDESGSGSDVNENDSDEQESDSAPEDVTFDASKDQSLKQAKLAMEQIQSDRQKIKQKRKQRNELFKVQKQQKLESLEKNRLPEDFLEDITSKPDKKELPVTKENTIKHFSDEDEEGTGSALFGDNEDEEEDYIALTKETGVKAVTVKKQAKKAKGIGQSAIDFRNNWLYGNRLKRQSAKEANAVKHKQGMLPKGR